MNDELLRKVIRQKIEIGMMLLEKAPSPVQNTGKKILDIIWEEAEPYFNKQGHQDNVGKQNKSPELGLRKQKSQIVGIPID